MQQSTVVDNKFFFDLTNLKDVLNNKVNFKSNSRRRIKDSFIFWLDWTEKSDRSMKKIEQEGHYSDTIH